MFSGLVVLVLVGNEFDKTEKLLHTLRCTCLILVLRYGRGCVMLFYIGFLILITRGGGVSRIMVVSFLLMKGLG